jgi:hypothetical protein
MSKRVPHNIGDMNLFLKKAKEKHGDKYNYSLVEYTNSITKVKIICPIHGEFEQTPKSHYKCECPKCGRESQIEKAKKTAKKYRKAEYGDLENHVLVDYISKLIPISTSKKYKKITKSTDKNLFMQEVTKIHGNKYDYTNTQVGNSRGKIKINCKEHGEFEIYMSAHFSGQGCPKCAMINYNKLRAKTTEKFIEEAKLIHGDKCDYTDTVYKTCKDKVTIKCNIHNEYFSVYPVNHLRGGRCRKCLSDNLSEAMNGNEGAGYSKSQYINVAKGKLSSVYLILCEYEGEKFYKVGRTLLTLNKRYNKSKMPYNYELIHSHYGEAGYIFDLEKELHRIYKNYKYKPNIKFQGHTECFNLDLPIDEIINKYE